MISEEADKEEEKDRTIFVKNLNFGTTEEQLEQLFKEAKVGKVKAVKIIRKAETQLSRGYGFVEFESKKAAENAIKKLQNVMLDDHSLKLSISKKSSEKETQNAKKRKAETDLDLVENEEAKSQKILVKNLAFEATQKDVRELFKGYG